MLFKTKIKSIHLSIYKSKKILEKIRGTLYIDALNFLYSLNSYSAFLIFKALKSAFFNISIFLKKNTNFIFIKEIFITKGSIIKKFFPRAKGKTDIRKKYYTNLNISLNYI